MQEMDDIVLLQEYVERDSHEAFATIVARHVNKVYSVALRQTRKRHQAEEITHAVFVILAQKAHRLSRQVVLSGWLYQTARLTAVTFIRSEIRRARREEEAYMQNISDETDSEAWSQIAPLLDAAMDGLNEADRHAVVLRFFDGKSMKEVGAALGANESAAKMRVNRAVEKLRLFFTRHGVVLSAAVLMMAISANSVQAAPTMLAQATTVMATAKGGAISTSTATLINGALKVMAWTKAKTVMAVGIAVILVSGTTGVVLSKTSKPGVFAKQKSASVSKQQTVVDRATPKGTMLVIADAMETGDATTYIESFVFNTRDELKLKSTMGTFIAATARFNRAISDKFGAEAAHVVFPSMPFAFPTNDIINLAEEKVSGDTATVSLGAKGGRPVQFTKIDSEWKMAADGFIHLSPAVMNDLYARVIKALDQTTPEIPLNQFKTAIEAVDKMKERAR
ncbi:MAG: polymerase, sigma-24 subunit, subfamily [Verrucomicrobiales bacterium]|nr:polymerase, sigma-24 subunit, subfamily [Verrucomicrobiales bacterium]